MSYCKFPIQIFANAKASIKMKSQTHFLSYEELGS